MHRDTAYAKLIAQGVFEGSRIERIHVKAEAQDEIRFSWWPDGRMANRPLDIPEDVLLPLIIDAIRKGVFSSEFLRKLHAALYEAALSRDAENGSKDDR